MLNLLSPNTHLQTHQHHITLWCENGWKLESTAKNMAMMIQSNWESRMWLKHAFQHIYTNDWRIIILIVSNTRYSYQTHVCQFDCHLKQWKTVTHRWWSAMMNLMHFSSENIKRSTHTHTQKSWNDTNSSWHFPLKNDESEEDSVVGKSLDVGTHFQRHGLCDCYCCCCCGCSCCCYRKVDLPTGKQWIWFYTKHFSMCWGVTVPLIDTQCFFCLMTKLSMHVSFIFMLY